MPPPNPWSSPRLTYRAIRPQDIAIFTAINTDPHGFANSNLETIKLATSQDASEFMKDCLEKQLLGAVIWLPHPPNTAPETITELKAKAPHGADTVESWGTAIGEFHLRALPKGAAHHRHTELGIDILPEFQGRGYGSEAISWALDYAFRRAGLHRVRVRAFGWNEGAIRLYERLGFVHEGREREAFWYEGRWWDGVEMSLLEGEWESLREKEREKEEGEGGGEVSGK